jgi:hypothetical protein
LIFGGTSPDSIGVSGELWALTWGADTKFALSCPRAAPAAPGDTTVFRFGIENPMAAGVQYGFSLGVDRRWPFTSTRGVIGAWGPDVSLPWGVVIPDTAAAGVVSVRFRTWLEDAPLLADSCTIQLEITPAEPEPSLALHRVWLDANGLQVDLSLAEREEGRVEVMDPAGRRLASCRVVPSGDRRQVAAVRLETSPGVCFVRVVQGRRSIARRFVVLR